MRMIVSTSSTTSIYVDFYNLHADAGTEDGDETARNSNLNQVADYIATWSAGNPVVVFGDTNSRYTRTADTAIQSLLATVNAAGAGLTDSFVEIERAGVIPTVETICDNPSLIDTCETVDKVLYRSSPLLTLSAEAFHYASSLFLQADGSVLSDHNPINVNFTWTAGASLQQSGFWGGPHGDWFSDVTTLSTKSKPKPSVLTFRGGSRLDSVGVTLSDGTVLTHGGTGGTAASLTLGSSEYWTSAQLCQGQKDSQTRNFYIKATTSSGNTLSSGASTSDCTTFTAPSGWHIVGFLGQDGDEMDQLAFIYAPK
jgi:hypothetical protein